jgi:ketosteroid isomerase-like protein
MATTDLDVAETILELERAALERWGRGDPEGFLEISAPDLSYFDPFIESRLDGLPALRSLYDQLRGKIHIDHFEIVEPRVQVAGDVAVLTFRFTSYSNGSSIDWNTTEVYQRGEAGWRIIHTHWAFHQPQLAS